MTVGDLLNKSVELLRSRGIESAKLDAEILISRALGWERMNLYTKSNHTLSKDEAIKCLEWLERRQGGEPVAYILGEKGFYKHDFIVSPDVLIPRPETELVVEAALGWIAENYVDDILRIVDLGAGSGCIGLSLIAEIENARLLAVDISLSALEILRANADRLGVQDRTMVWDGDAGNLDINIVTNALGGKVHVVVANPPYISIHNRQIEKNVKEFEPQTALFSGVDGLEAIRAWSRTAAQILLPGGICVFEIGNTQALEAKEIFNSLPFFEEVNILKDLAGHDRVVTARKISHG
jgi:release factor glutamine methyltransferase